MCLFKGGYELLLASDPRNCRTSWLKTTFCSLQVLFQAGVTLFRELTCNTLELRTGTHVGHVYRNCYWWVTLTNFECIDKFYQDFSLTDFAKIHLWFLCCYVYTDKQTDRQTNTLQRIVTSYYLSAANVVKRHTLSIKVDTKLLGECVNRNRNRKFLFQLATSSEIEACGAV